jgi:hypothetical protein
VKLHTNETLKKSWPKDVNGGNVDLKDYMDITIGVKLNKKLGKYYDGFGSSPTEESWLFTDVPSGLVDQLEDAFLSKCLWLSVF